MNAERLSFFGELQRRHVYKVGATYAVAGWLLVQIATQVFPFFEVSNAAVRWVVIAVIAGFPVALVLAWIFDLTPQGLVRTADVPPSGESQATQKQRHGMDRRLNYLLGGLLLLSLGYLVLDHTLLRRAAPSDTTDGSIAVLPLANTSGDPANEYFSDGLSEELIAVLAKIPHLKLIGRSSSFQFKNQSADSRSIGEKLGVANLLEGSVRRQGERVRIVAELIRAADGRELWSETYDRELKDVFAVQSEIAAAVADQLRLRLLSDAGAPRAASTTQNLEAHNAVLQGDFYAARLTPEDARKSIEYYDEAIRLDSGYALAYARLSRAWRFLAAIYLEGAEVEEGYARSRRAAEQALTLAPDLAEAHEALGGLRLTPDLDFAAAETELRRAVELAPAIASATQMLAYTLAAQGRYAEAEATFHRAIELDPLNVASQVNLARMLVALGRLDEAEAFLSHTIALQPTAFHQYVHLVTIDLLRHDVAAAAGDAEREHPGFWLDFERALVKQAQNDSKAADAALQEFIAKHQDIGAFQVAELYALRKEPDKMFEWLDRSLQVHDSGLTQLVTMPLVDAYKSDPRFIALCRKLKIDPAVLAGLP
jgi:serine/threonine-protein kinase